MDGNTHTRQEPPEERQPTSQNQIQNTVNPHHFRQQLHLEQPGECVCVCVWMQKEEELPVCEENIGVLLVRKASGTERRES